MLALHSLQQNYLQAMGIVRWQLRQKSSTLGNDGEFYVVQDPLTPIPRFLLIADASADLGLQVKEKRLLNAICHACGISESVLILSDSALPVCNSDDTRILLLGSRVILHYLPDYKGISTRLDSDQLQQNYYLIHDSLQYLLQQPNLKAKLWLNLQSWIQEIV